MHDDQHGPGLKFPPPLLPAAIVILGWGLNRPWPLILPDALWIRVSGIGLTLAAVLLAIAVVIQFHRAQTHVEPWKPASRLLQTGVFALSRNPIYLCFCVATAGIGLWFANGWILLGTAPLLLLLQWLVIRREETYLQGKFGDEYRRYCERVRRWI